MMSLLLGSCASNQLISNGAYSDISLNRNSDEYDLKRLNEINSTGSSIFGIPLDESIGNNYGMVVRFNGVNVSGTKRILPILSLLATTVALGPAIGDIIGIDDQALATVAALPVAGMINNLTYGQISSTSRAFQRFNRTLVEDNPDIDVFLNPKYQVKQEVGIFNSKTKVKGSVMGATLKTN
tara:strand:+ start:83 stop:628 length:546 start_codon:yes stop_codon:yes gene_type:complete